MKIAFPWFNFWLLYGAGLLCGLAVLPFTRRLLGSKAKVDASLRKAIALQFVPNALILALSVYFGMKAALATGLARSVTRNWIGAIQGFPTEGLAGLLAGSLSAVLVCLLDYYVLLPRLPSLGQAVKPIVRLALRYKLLAAVCAGFVEELIMRLGVFSLLVWFSKALLHLDESPMVVLWSVNVVTSLLFAAGHLPAMAALAPLTPGIVARIILLNFLLSLVFGFAYFTWGLEGAILAHTSASVALQLIGDSRVLH